MKKLCAAAWLLAALAIGVDAHAAEPTPPVSEVAPSSLFVIDQHRTTVVERVVNEWGDRLALSGAQVSREQLREMLFAMRADHLLAASLAGSVNGLRDVLANALSAPATSRAGLMQTKALGDSSHDVVYTPVTPCRLVETRPGTFAAVYQGGGAFAPNEIRNYTVQGGNGVCLSQLSAALNPSAVQLQVFGIPINSGSNADIEILPQGSTFGSTATEVYVGNVLINTVSTTANINLANDQIGVQVRGGGANVAIDVVGYFKQPGNYGGTHTITGQYATDGGGFGNTASGNYGTVAGGNNNIASGFFSTVAGGTTTLPAAAMQARSEGGTTTLPRVPSASSQAGMTARPATLIAPSREACSTQPAARKASSRAEATTSPKGPTALPPASAPTRSMITHLFGAAASL